MPWQFDRAHTSIDFSVKHMMFTTVRGRIGVFAGEIQIDDADPAASAVTGAIDVATITTGDKDRDHHLHSADFFNADRFPQMTFRSTQVKAAGKSQYKVTGDLTIRDVTRPITWDVRDLGEAKDPWGNRRRALRAKTSISRKDYGITWNVALESGGWLVGDQVNISAELQLVQAKVP